ncbi:ribonuclease H-like domain-containing protein [Tanacetum coccineum]
MSGSQDEIPPPPPPPDVMVETLLTMVDKHIKEQVMKQVPEQVRNQVPYHSIWGEKEDECKAAEDIGEFDALCVWESSFGHVFQRNRLHQLINHKTIIEEVVADMDELAEKMVDVMLRSSVLQENEHQIQFDWFYEVSLKYIDMEKRLWTSNLVIEKLSIFFFKQKVNLTAPTMTFLGIEDHEMFSIIYEPVHGIIYKNSKKEKRVMRHSEIHKFCDATFNRVLEGLNSYNNDIKYGMESYLQKIDFIVTILTSLDARVNDEDVVHYPLEGLPDKYNQMRLKSKALALPMDSSSPMVLVAESSTNSRSSTSKGKSWKPCFNFAKGFCCYGDSCRYAHDANARVSNANSGFNKVHGTSENTTHDLLNKLLAQLGHLEMNVAMSNNGTNITLPNPATVTPTVTRPNIASTIPTAPHAFYASLVHTTMGPVNYSSQDTQPTGSLVMGSAPSSGVVNTSGASSYLNNSVTSLSIILNSCMYSTVSVGDGHSVSVTNTGHSILSTPLKSLRLNNVLITPTWDSIPVTASFSLQVLFLFSSTNVASCLGHPGSEVL